MKSLLFRLLLWLGFTFALLAASILALCILHPFSDDAPEEDDFLAHYMDMSCETIVKINATLGHAEAREFMEAQVRGQSFVWHVYVPNHADFTMQRVPQRLHDIIRNAQSDEVEIYADRENGKFGAVKHVDIGSLHADVILEGRAMPSVMRIWGMRFAMIAQGVCTFLLIGGLWYLLYCNVVEPLRELQSAARGIADGRLDCRISESVINRGDEIGDVGIAFNTMTQHIEKLITSQRRLLHDVSHELRSPLTRVGLAVELARKCPPTAACGYLERIEAESKRLDELIDQLLLLSRVESDSQPLTEETVDLAALVESIVEDARFEATPIHVRIIWSYDATAIVNANMQLLGSAIENVMRNALRYAPENTAITVSMKTEEQAAIITIRDHGPGVPESELQNIFEPFFVVPRDNGKPVGAGVGLSITHRVITSLGGHVFARNAASGGLQCVVSLPLSVPTSDAQSNT